MRQHGFEQLALLDQLIKQFGIVAPAQLDLETGFRQTGKPEIGSRPGEFVRMAFDVFGDAFWAANSLAAAISAVTTGTATAAFFAAAATTTVAAA